MKIIKELNLYRVVTSYEGEENFANYYVVAENGVVAGSVVNLKLNSRIRKTVLKNGTVNHPKEQVDEVERIANDLIIPDFLFPPSRSKLNKKKITNKGNPYEKRTTRTTKRQI